MTLLYLSGKALRHFYFGMNSSWCWHLVAVLKLFWASTGLRVVHDWQTSSGSQGHQSLCYLDRVCAVWARTRPDQFFYFVELLLFIKENAQGKIHPRRTVTSKNKDTGTVGAGLSDSLDHSNDPCKTAYFHRKLHPLVIGIAALRKVQLLCCNSLKEQHYAFSRQGKGTDETLEYGVGIAASTHHQRSFLGRACPPKEYEHLLLQGDCNGGGDAFARLYWTLLCGEPEQSAVQQWWSPL